MAENMHTALPLPERLIAKSERIPVSGCWLWLGCVLQTGYGSIHRKNGHISAHRASYETFVGPIPDGLCVLHRCDVRCCINPSHLFLGTHKDNAIDRVQKGRHVDFQGIKTHCKYGHEYTPENTARWKGPNGSRSCRTCTRGRVREWHRMDAKAERIMKQLGLTPRAPRLSAIAEAAGAD